MSYELITFSMLLKYKPVPFSFKSTFVKLKVLYLALVLWLFMYTQVDKNWHRVFILLIIANKYNKHKCILIYIATNSH